jgi:hypothetical protein
MDLIRLENSAAFARERTRLSWREVLFGIEQELFDPQGVIDLAVDELASRDDASAALVELAGSERHESTRALVEQLAGAEPVQASDEVEHKWLYLVLSWMYVHKDSYRDPLRVVEAVYADFGYPARIRAFVGYMPVDEADLGSEDLGEQRLYRKWKEYLDETSAVYAP